MPIIIYTDLAIDATLDDLLVVDPGDPVVYLLISQTSYTPGLSADRIVQPAPRESRVVYVGRTF